MSIIALHSSQSHGGQWRALARQLPSEVSFQSPDLIGYGRATSYASLAIPAAQFRLQDELNALQAAEVFPAREPVTLLGHSYGGALALKWALEHPSQVAQIVVYEPVAFHILDPKSTARREIEAVATAMESFSAAEACAHFVDYWNRPGYFAALPEVAQQLMISQQDKVSADFHALLDEPHALADYAALTCPVTLVVGRQSPLSSRTVAAELSRVISHAKTVEVMAGHMGPLTDARTVNPVLLDALIANSR